MSAGEPAVALHAVLAKLTAVRECLVVAATVIEQAVSIIGYMPTSYAAVLEELRVVWRSVAETEQLIEAHLASAEHPGNGTPSSGAPQVPSQVGPNPTPARPRLAPSPASPGVENKHGDRYPVEAVPYCDDLPPRVRRGMGNVVIVGHALIDGRGFGTLTAHRSDGWTQEVGQRLQTLDMRQAVRVANHVEMKVVMVMVNNHAHHGKVIINHAPRGSGDPSQGCHDYLESFLPEGRTLTVLGSDAQGNPFKRIYRRKAPL